MTTADPDESSARYWSIDTKMLDKISKLERLDLPSFRVYSSDLKMVLRRIDRRYTDWLVYCSDTDDRIPEVLASPWDLADESLLFTISFTLGTVPRTMLESHTGGGFTFYRKLSRKCDPVISTRGVGIIRGIVNYTFPKGDFQAGVTAVD